VAIVVMLKVGMKNEQMVYVKCAIIPVIYSAHHGPLFEPIGIDENANGLVETEEIDCRQQGQSVIIPNKWLFNIS
jgi:hypothetical protein